MAGISGNLNIDNLHNHSANLIDINGEIESGNVILTYDLDDPSNDILDIIFRYRLEENEDWIPFDTVETIIPTQYSNLFDWNSKDDIPGIDQLVEIMAMPTDGWQEGNPAIITVLIDNNELPEVSIDPIPSELNGVIDFVFTLEDAENDEINFVFEYFHNGEWTPVPENSVTLAGQTLAQWDSESVFQGLDENIRFAIIPSDNDEGVGDTTSIFNLDNMHFHNSELDDISGEIETGIVTLSYDVSDESFDDLEVNFYYRKTSSDDWVFFHDIDNIIPIDGSYPDNMTYEWDTEGVADLRLLDSDDFWVKVVATDGFVPETDGGDSIVFHLDNNEFPTVVINPIAAEVNGSFSIIFNVDDAEDDSVGFVFEYSLDNGPWLEASIELDNTMRSAFVGMIDQRRISESPIGQQRPVYVFQPNRLRDEMSIIWNSHLDVEAADEANAKFRITPWDNVLGFLDADDFDYGNAYESNSFRLDNFQGHFVEITSDFSDQQIGNISFQYQLTDSSNDTLDIDFEYFNESEQSWQPMTIQGPVENINSSQYQGEVIWNSTEDLDGIEVTNLITRIRVTDGWLEGVEDSAIFHLDNNDPPTISQFTNPMQGEEVHGTINLGLVPYDEENDEITLQFQWSTDEENWESFGSENYNYPYNVSFEWNSIDDISDEEVDLFVRVISQDGEDDNDKDTSLTWNFCWIMTRLSLQHCKWLGHLKNTQETLKYNIP